MPQELLYLYSQAVLLGECRCVLEHTLLRLTHIISDKELLEGTLTCAQALQDAAVPLQDADAQLVVVVQPVIVLADL